MNDLEKYFFENKGTLVHKWHHYFEIYDQYFHRFRNKPVVILEIGVFHGGSLLMWRDYFGDQAKIFGIDVNPRLKELEAENIKIFIGSQSDPKFLQSIKDQIPPIDILIDDGGHKMKQQIITFQEMFEKVQPDGIYICEDTQTSYQLGYGGGHKRMGTFIEYTKNFIDSLHAYHSEQGSLQVNSFTRSVRSIHYYDSMVVIEKGQHNQPIHSKKGVPRFEMETSVKPKSIALEMLYAINTVLRFFNLPSLKLNK